MFIVFADEWFPWLKFHGLCCWEALAEEFGCSGAEWRAGEVGVEMEEEGAAEKAECGAEGCEDVGVE